MQNLELKELLDAKFTHISAEIKAQGTLLEEKVNHNKDYVGAKMDEMINHQKRTNGRVLSLEGESEKCKEHRTEDAVNKRMWGRMRAFLYVLVPSVLILVGLQVKAYFEVQNKVDVETFIKMQADLTLLVEAKTRAQESLAKTNAQDIAHTNQYVAEIKAAQDEIDKFLYEKYRVRGPNDKLPEF